MDIVREWDSDCWPLPGKAEDYWSEDKHPRCCPHPLLFVAVLRYAFECVRSGYESYSDLKTLSLTHCSCFQENIYPSHKNFILADIIINNNKRFIIQVINNIVKGHKQSKVDIVLKAPKMVNIPKIWGVTSQN